MLDWLKKLVSRSTTGAATPQEAQLRRDLARLGDAITGLLSGLEANAGGQARAGLAADVASFLTTGAPATVLTELAGHPGLAGHFGLTWHGNTAVTADAAAFYANLQPAPPELLVRWGNVLLATTRQAQFRTPAFAVEGDRRWLEPLVAHSLGCKLDSFSTNDAVTPRGLTAAMLEAALVADGASAGALVCTALTSPVDRYGYSARRIATLFALPDFADALHRHRDLVRTLLQPPAIEQRLHCLRAVATAQDHTLGELAAPLVAHATGSSKQVRAAAEPLVLRAAAGAVPSLRATATDGEPEARGHALRLVHRIATMQGDDALLAFARATAAADKAASVRELPAAWDATARASDAPPAVDLQVELPTIDWRVAITTEIDAALDQLLRGYRAAVAKRNESAARAKAAGRSWPTTIEAFGAEVADELRTELASPQAPGRRDRRGGNGEGLLGDALAQLAGAADLPSAFVAKILAYFDLFAQNGALSHNAACCFEALHARTGRPTLLELSALANGCGFGPGTVLASYCRTWHAIGRDWPAEHVWPLFAHELDRVDALLQQPPRDHWFDVPSLFRGIGMLPSLPPLLTDRLFALALGTGKTDRPLAQAALANVGDKELRIANALGDGKSEVRAAAAAWLRQLGSTSSIAALEAAVAKEKNDVTKGALLDALESLGCPVEKYLDRDRLAEDAQRGLAKGLPADLTWLRVDGLPVVTWRDGGATVTREVLAWLCVQASKAKSPEPNVLLRKYTAMFETASARELAQSVLEQWLQEDIAPIAPDEARQLAQATAQSTFDSIRRYPQYHTTDPNRDLSVEELTAKFLPGLLRKPRGSAVASKGVLAVVAACGGERVAGPVGRYLKEWFGTRAAQGKALIAMLAWVDHPSAIQLMLSVGNRFRTKSFQEEAMKQAQALAERRGWTLDQLADRTMPSAGFDEQGVLELSYGPRTFTAHLHADLSVELRNPDGKKITSLPVPRSDDDAELAKAAKKALSAAKKELKTIAALQMDRLYEAMCTGRDWSAADWTTYLLPHPVVRHLVQRLVWIEVGADGSRRLFRPLDDGTLTDADDEPLLLRDDARVQLAHDSNLDTDSIAAWQKHLADYEVDPLFQQLGKGSFRLPAEKARATRIDDFVGHLLEAFALRGRAGKLGYVRGPTEDGGWFWTYVKRFPTLGIAAVMHFTGNPLPETNRTVALQQLVFHKKVGDRELELPLGEVPAVLLSECWQDLRLCAAEGTGFAADWEQRSEYK